MTLSAKIAQFDALEKLADSHYGKITEAEKEVLHVSESAEDVCLREVGKRPSVRADFLRWLATDRDAARHIDPLGFRIYNATVESDLDLNFSEIPFCMRFRHCTFTGQLLLRSAKLSALRIIQCNIQRPFLADGLTVSGDLAIHATNVEDKLTLISAQIDGNLDCAGTHLLSTPQALIADGARIEGSVFLYSGDFENQHFSSMGTVRLVGVKIGVDLDCSNATFSGNGDALMANRADVKGNVYLNKKFSSKGPIQMEGAQIGGALVCSEATLSATENTLTADGTRIEGNVYLNEKFSSKGAIRLVGAKIGGDLYCSDAALHGTENALSADRVQIKGSVFLNGKFTSIGNIRLLGAQIDGDLDCSGANLSLTNDALNADRARIKGNVFLNKNFSSIGNISFVGAQLGANLDCLGARIKKLDAEDMSVKGSLIWAGIKSPKETTLNLAGASVKDVHDDRKSWPRYLFVKNFIYSDLTLHNELTAKNVESGQLSEPLELRTRDRIKWLSLQNGPESTDSHAWMQLAKLFREKGEDREQRRVLLNYRLRMASRSSLVRRPFRKLLARLAFEPLYILMPFILILVSGTVIFHCAGQSKQMRPTNESAASAWKNNQPYPAAYPAFNSFIYTLENELPLVTLGMDHEWAPDPNLVKVRPGTYWFLAIAHWFLILVGWLQGIALTVGINRRFKD